MRKRDFRIGLEFVTAAGRWRCTDVGTRTIVAIKLDQSNQSWYPGPPYAVVEEVFDEYDLPGCRRVRPALKRKGGIVVVARTGAKVDAAAAVAAERKAQESRGLIR